MLSGNWAFSWSQVPVGQMFGVRFVLWGELGFLVSLYIRKGSCNVLCMLSSDSEIDYANH